MYYGDMMAENQENMVNLLYDNNPDLAENVQSDDMYAISATVEEDYDVTGEYMPLESETDEANVICYICNADFPSNNQLHQHLQECKEPAIFHTNITKLPVIKTKLETIKAPEGFEFQH